MSFDLNNYTTVNDRLIEFFQKYPDGRIQNSVPKVIEFDDRPWWLVTTTIWRSPDDLLPVIASAAEPKGTTPYTRDSEMMNCESSAIGRALILVGGIGIRAGGSMASRNEVQNRAGAEKTETGTSSGSAPARTFPNKFAKPCMRCGMLVPIGAGVSWRDGDDKYRTAHKQLDDGRCDAPVQDGEEPF